MELTLASEFKAKGEFLVSGRQIVLVKGDSKGRSCLHMSPLSNKMANKHNNGDDDDYYNTNFGPRRTAKGNSGLEAQAKIAQVDCTIQQQQHERLVGPVGELSGQQLRNTHHHPNNKSNENDHHDPHYLPMAMKFKRSTNNGKWQTQQQKQQQLQQTNARKLIVPQYRGLQPSKWFHLTRRDTKSLLLVFAQLTLLLAVACCPLIVLAAEQQVSADQVANQQPAAAAEPTPAAVVVAPESAVASVDQSPKASSTNDAAAAAVSNVTPNASSAPENGDSKPKGESLLAAESAQSPAEKYSSPLANDSQVDSLQSAQKQLDSRADAQQQQQVEEVAVPAVSGLSGQEELQSSTEASAAILQPQTTSASFNQQQSLDSGDQQQTGNGGQSQQQQQLVDVGGSGGSDSTTRVGGAENDVLSSGEQFGRKSSNEPQSGGEFAQSQSQSQSNPKGKVRSLKRAFGGHMGVFGRKRTSNSEQVNVPSTAAAAADEFQQQAIGFEQPATRPSVARSHHYYYQHLDSEATTSRPQSGSTRSKLKEADFPDYREILIQSDKADVLKQPQSIIDASMNQELARTKNFQQQQQQQQQQQVDVQQVDQQRIEQGNIQVNENDFTEQPEVKQQTETSAPFTVDQLNQTSSGEQSDISSGGIKQQQQQQHDQAPFIRLSNIATINSSSPDSGNSTNGVKLMRIYVIDLDQKLVVGGASGSSKDGAAKGVQLALPESQSSPAATPHYEAAGYSATGNVSGTDQQQQQQQLSQYEQQQASVVPEGYVLLDRDSLQSNLSQMFSKLGPQYEQSTTNLGLSHSTQATPTVTSANYSYTIQHPARAAQQAEPTAASLQSYQLYQQPSQQQQQQQQQYQLTDPPSGPLWSAGAQPASYLNASVQVSGGFAPQASHYLHQQHQQQHQMPTSGYDSRGSNYTQVIQGSNQGFYPAEQVATAAIYPEQAHQYQQQPQNHHPNALPQHHHHHQQQQQQQQQLYQSVPQYIAPQYRPTTGFSGNLNNPDNEYANEWSQPQQQLGHHHYQQQQQHPLNAPELQSSPLPPLPLPSQHSSNAPGAMEQVRYNNNNNSNNYTSKPTLFVQAPTSRQQDKHHANGSNHLNVYHHQVEQTPMMYQQQPAQSQHQHQQHQVVILDPTPVFSTQAHSALAAASAYSSSLRVEPAQAQPQPYFKHNNEQPNGAAHKVTTATLFSNASNDQNWKPVDYSAPSVYSQTQHNYLQSQPQPQQQQQQQPQQSSISPAQYTNNRPSINGYKDHDVVSLASGQQKQPKQVVGAHQQQRQVEAPGQIEAENPALSMNYSVPQSNLGYDGQHAPVNYQQQQSRKSYPSANNGNGTSYYTNKQASYVNTQTVASSNADDTQNTYPTPNNNSNNIAAAPVYPANQQTPTLAANSYSANDAPSQQVLVAQTGAHPSFSHQLASQTAYQYNGTGMPQSTRGYSTTAATASASAGGHSAWSAGSGETQAPSNEYHQAASRQPQQQYGVTNEYPNPKALSKQHSGPASYVQAENAEEQQYGTNPLAAYGNQQQQLTGTKQPIKLLANDQSLANEGPRIPSQGANNYRHSYKQTSPPTSAYLAVNGPPIADGVYSSEEPTIPTKQAPKPRYRGQAKQAARGKPKRPSGPSHKSPNVAPESSYSASQQQEQQDGYSPTTEQVNSEQVNQVAAEDYVGAAQYGAAYNNFRPLNAYTNGPQHLQAQYQRPPMVAVANYYRAPPGARGLLSWETLQSVASGAAKRLPSLSSILMPFSSPSKGGLYPTANYPQQQHQQPHQQYTKSAHFDRDVSNFHRPYPLRHMQQHSTNGPNGYQQQQESAAQLDHTGGSKHEEQLGEGGSASDLTQEAEQQQAGEYGGDLSLASSANSNSADSSQTSASGVAAASPTAAAAADEVAFNGETHESNSDEISEIGNARPSGNLTNVLNLHETDETIPSKAADVIEFAPDQEPSSNGAGKSARVRPVGRPKGNNSNRAPKGAQLEVGGSKLVAQDDPTLDTSQAAVLGSIEHQLASGGKQTKRKPSPKRNKIPTLSSGSSAAAVAAAAAAAAASADFLEPTILAPEHNPRLPVPLESLPADQQRLLLGGKGRGLPYVGGPTNIMFPPSSDEQYSSDRRPPRPLNSMQIGQFKLTPQTQFVQSIIEPSRQMIGQYFKQYIGQLGQTLG